MKVIYLFFCIFVYALHATGYGTQRGMVIGGDKAVRISFAGSYILDSITILNGNKKEDLP